MPHADSLALPSDTLSKREFYEHVCNVAEALLAPASSTDPAANWITVLSNAASLLFGSYENYGSKFGREDGRRVNWAGFYITPSLMTRSTASAPPSDPTQLLLGPFHGRPACNSVSLRQASPSRPVGVCAASYLAQETVIVENVNARPGHIACDGVTQSEIVLPLTVRVRRPGEAAGSSEEGDGEELKVGVLDIDCEGLAAFDEEDKAGLEQFVEVLKRVIRWDA